MLADLSVAMTDAMKAEMTVVELVELMVALRVDEMADKRVTMKAGWKAVMRDVRRGNQTVDWSEIWKVDWMVAQTVDGKETHLVGRTGEKKVVRKAVWKVVWMAKWMESSSVAMRAVMLVV